ncbi:hypothetical protein D9M72_519980 [compost metagenome]
MAVASWISATSISFGEMPACSKAALPARCVQPLSKSSAARAEAERTTLASTLTARLRSKPYFFSADSVQTMAAAAPSEIGEHIGSVIG